MNNDKMAQIRVLLHSLEGDYSYTSKERIGPMFFAILFCLICPVLFIHAAWADQMYSGLTRTQDFFLACGMSIVSFVLGYILYARSRYRYIISSSHVKFFSRPGKLKWNIPIDGITEIDFPPNSGKFSMRLHFSSKTFNIDLSDELRIKILDRFDKNTNQLKIT